MSERPQQGPMAVLSSSSQRIAGDDARSMNLQAARAVAETVRTTLGPRGMDKMLVDDEGTVIVTNDGITLLAEMNVTHPAAQAVVEVAATQEEVVGDGTTSAVILAGELLAGAEELLDDGLHPTTIVGGYEEAADVAIEAAQSVASPVNPADVDTLERIARTAMTGKGAEAARDQLATAVVRAVRTALGEDGRVEDERIVVRTFPTGAIEDSRYLSGYLFDFIPSHQGMPRTHEDADVLCYAGALETAEAGVDPTATVGDFEEYNAYVERERVALNADVQRIIDVGADVVLVDGNIAELAREQFVEAGITGFYETDEDEMRRLAMATGARIVGDLETMSAEDLGFAGDVHEEKIRMPTFKKNAPPERTTVFDDLPTGDWGTILLRASTDHVLEEVERAVVDGVGVVTSAIEDHTAVPGGGATEIEIARAVREAADGVEGREQLAVEAYADAMEAAPRILATNGGHDPIDALVGLRNRHADGVVSAGIDADTGAVDDAAGADVIEPLRSKTTAITTTVEAVSTILRIDDVVAAEDLSIQPDEDDE